MGARQTELKPKGLITQPSKFGWVEPGGLSRAINAVMRNPGELAAAPSMFAGLTVGPVNNSLRALLALNAGHVYELSRSAGDVWSVTELGNAVTLPSNTSTTGLFNANGRLTPLRAKERSIFNSLQGTLVGDSMAPTTAAERALRMAGLKQLSWRGGRNGSPGARGTIPQTTPALVYGYVAINTREFSDGYKLISVPTQGVKRFGSAVAEVQPIVTVQWATGDVLLGDVIELYRSDGKITTTPLTANEEPNDVYKLVSSRRITAAEVAAGLWDFIDNARMGDGPYYQTNGQELYCNPFDGGATVMNRQPPLAGCLAEYDGRVFYGNTTDRPKLQFKIPAGLAFTAGSILADSLWWRNNGIGTRYVAGATLTNGSPTITGIAAGALAGIVPGQYLGVIAAPVPAQWSGTGQPTVIAVNVGAGTVTMSANWIAATTGPTTVIFADVLYIGFNGGTKRGYRFGEGGDLIVSMAGLGYIPAPGNLFEVTSGQNAYLGDAGSTTVAGLYNPNVTYAIEPKDFGVSFVTMEVTATNGVNYSPPIPEFNATPLVLSRTNLKNRLTWSKPQQPEHVNPGNNENFVGLRDLVAMKATKDAVWISCLDGIFRLTGVGGQYRLDQIDNTKIICGPQCMTSLDEDVYIYTNFGMLQVSNERRNNITDLVIGDLLGGPEYSETFDRILVSNEEDLEILYRDSDTGNRLWVYSTRGGGAWTTLENNAAALSNITALTYQRNPVSGIPRVLVGVSPAGGVAPSYAGWGNTASYLTLDALFQPMYAGNAMSVKKWIEASFLFDASNANKTLRPNWNGTPIGLTTAKLDKNACYARAGIPRAHGISVSIAPGCDSVLGTGVQPRLLGVSLKFEELTLTAKQK